MERNAAVLKLECESERRKEALVESAIIGEHRRRRRRARASTQRTMRAARACARRRLVVGGIDGRRGRRRSAAGQSAAQQLNVGKQRARPNNDAARCNFVQFCRCESSAAGSVHRAAQVGRAAAATGCRCCCCRLTRRAQSLRSGLAGLVRAVLCRGSAARQCARGRTPSRSRRRAPDAAPLAQILRNVLASLQENAQRRFVWAEISFFELFWRNLDEASREEMRRLVAQRRFVFVEGGWVQHGNVGCVALLGFFAHTQTNAHAHTDEANPSVDAIVDQVTEGHEFLRRTFGLDIRPKIAWQIGASSCVVVEGRTHARTTHARWLTPTRTTDPFGHSTLSGALFAKMGFQAVVLNRVHFALKDDFKRAQVCRPAAATQALA